MLDNVIAKIMCFVNRLFNPKNVEVADSPAAKLYKEVFSELANNLKDEPSLDAFEVQTAQAHLEYLGGKPSDVFDAALEFLWDGVGDDFFSGNIKNRFICSCTECTSYTTPVKDFCKDIIRERLNGHSSLEGWLITKGHANPQEIYSNLIKLQETRRQWLISLRDEFKAKGM
jgi:hypothetical protein